MNPKQTAPKRRPNFLLGLVKTMWMAGVEPEKIAQQHDISVATIQNWCNKYKWVEELNHIGSQGYKAIVEKLTKKVNLNMARRLGLCESIEKQVAELLKQPQTPNNLERLVGVVNGLDKLESQMIARGYNDDVEADEINVAEMIRNQGLEDMEQDSENTV